MVFQVTVLDERKSNDTDVEFVISSEEIQGALPVDILVITIDICDNLNFNLPIDQICVKWLNQSYYISLMRLNFLLAARCSLLFARCWLLLASCFLLVVRYFLLIAHYFFVQITVK